mmetsp:Transcript_85113/g.253740  ORF Transcript_85113/g.253740 Transcript_85113/m.253740 type:complete len:273 (-) Transcript_85113:74-892(-)
MPIALAMSRTKLVANPSTLSAISTKGRWIFIVSVSPTADEPHPRFPALDEPPQLSWEAIFVRGLAKAAAGASTPGASRKAPKSAPGEPPAKVPGGTGALSATAGKLAASLLPKAAAVGLLLAGKSPLPPPPKAPNSCAPPGAAAGKAGRPPSAQPPPPLPKAPKSAWKPPSAAQAPSLATALSKLGTPPGQPASKPPPSEAPPAKASPPQASSFSRFFFFSFLRPPPPESEPSEARSTFCAPPGAACDSSGEKASSPRDGPVVAGASGADTL